MRAATFLTFGLLLAAPPAYAQSSPNTAEPNEQPTDKVEEAPIEETLDPSRPPARGKGVVWGVVTSRKDGETLLEALVTVIGRKEYSTTDEQGRYRLELVPGNYQLRVQYELHRPTRVKNVRVAAGRVQKLDVVLDPDELAVEEVTAVEAEVERASAATQLFLRKNAAQASDSIGAQDIAKAPDRNAADAVKRVVGTTVVDGRYIFVRGLGDRYTSSLLNGSPVPSPEPDRQAVPLDMFPTLVISDLTVSKTFVPDMPGDFTGGSLDIHTRDLPNRFLFQANLGAGINTVSTFGRRLSYPGGSTDWLGIDDGGRRLPREVPATRQTRLLPNGQVNPNLVAAGRAINTPMETDRTFNLPNGTGSLVAGDSFKPKRGPFGCPDCVVGYIAGASYSRRFQKRTDEVIRTFGVDANDPGGLVRFNDYRAETGVDTVTWSGLGTVSYARGTDHKLSLTGLYSRNAEKEGRRIEGINDEVGGNRAFDERLRFVNRALMYGQLRGEHRFRKLDAAELRWTALWARATLSDPNLRETVYVEDPIAGYSFRESTQSGQHFYAAQGETTRSVGADWTQPLLKGDKPVKVKGGGLFTFRGRSFEARRFRFLRAPGAGTSPIFNQRPNVIFTDENVGPVIELNEWTQGSDRYAANYDVYAGYLMTDVMLLPRLRLVAGQRLEASRQSIDSFENTTPVSFALNKTDLLPSANLIFKLTEHQNVRLTATRTVARPQLRELAPFLFTDFFGARDILGNPNLDRTRVSNLDARWEMFPRVGEVLAISLFHKDFTDPIEQVILPTSRGVISYANARGAVNTGLEVEGRKGLDFLSSRLKDFGVLANVTVVHSRVDLDPSRGIQTSSSRPLAGQSPYVVNVALDWNNERSRTRARILYNVAGERISSVGSKPLPDIYEQPRHLLDLSIAQSIGEHFDVKGAIENLLDSPVRFKQGDVHTNRYNLGTTFWFTGTYSY
ncbi:MAG: TonB-dependent receptor [Labilithrix sp.]|nr:TonB-dependent receptor [Labilithrix sp.]MCW5812774.1 TonB-dependent receptor [Labilithrix sp.]